MKMKYLDMIAEAVFHLSREERKGPSLKAIWGYLSTHWPESTSNYKVFRVQLRRIT